MIRKNTKTFLILAILFAVAAGLFAAGKFSKAGAAEGRWIILHPERKTKYVVVEIDRKRNEFIGKIVWLEAASAVDKHGNREPLVGKQILSGFHYDASDNDYDDGEIYNPLNGKSYKSYMRVCKNGRQLHVRGYVLIPLLGKTMTLYREK